MDNVSKNHNIDIKGKKGTQSIIFKDGTTVNLQCMYILMSFHKNIPTHQEITKLSIYDIAMEDWNPQTYYDGMNDNLSIISSVNSGEHNQHPILRALKYFLITFFHNNLSYNWSNYRC